MNGVFLYKILILIKSKNINDFCIHIITNQNDAHHTSTSIGRTTLDAWQQWHEVHKHLSLPDVQHGQNRVQGNNSVWEKPSETWLKCNVDAAFHDRNHLTSFACCVRDSRGQFIGAQTKWKQANMTILEGRQ